MRRGPHHAAPGRPSVARALLSVCLASIVWSLPERAGAQEAPPLPERAATLEWSASQAELVVARLSFRDVVTSEIRKKLTRGLPTTIVFTATLHQSGREEPVATTAQTCKITWHVWHEAYRIELNRPGSKKTRWTTEVEGVLRRCAEATGLLVATADQIGVDQVVFLQAKVQVNPISEDVLQKIQRWVSRPARTGTAAPGDALFSTFAGLFMQRIGDAEHTLEFRTKPEVPRKKPNREKGKARREG